MPRKPAAFSAEHSIVEEAIPAAIRIKLEILDARLSAIDTLGDIMHRRLKGLPTKNQRINFQANVIVLYQHLKQNFKNKAKIHNLDEIIIQGKDVPFNEMYDYFRILQKKMHTMKITNLGIRKIDDTKVM